MWQCLTGSSMTLADMTAERALIVFTFIVDNTVIHANGTMFLD